jgi:two-component system, cell cycle sensor histidine kinase and response regulator CckA
MTQGTKTILVAEDEPLVRNMITMLLQGRGYAVLEAGNGLEALQVAREHSHAEIDLLLTDVAMPQMDGIQLVREFRNAFPNTKIILMSGYTGESKLQYVTDESDITFLEKPFPIQSLEEKVRDLLGQPV